MPPPWLLAELPLNVELVMVSVPPLAFGDAGAAAGAAGILAERGAGDDDVTPVVAETATDVASGVVAEGGILLRVSVPPVL